MSEGRWIDPAIKTENRKRRQTFYYSKIWDHTHKKVNNENKI